MSLSSPDVPPETVAQVFAVDDMVTVQRVNGWSLKVLARNATSFGTRARSGALHVQVVHPGHRVRLVTPCALTDGEFEVHHHQRVRIRCWGCTMHYLREHGIQPPSLCWITHALRTWVHPLLIGVASHDGTAAVEN